MDFIDDSIQERVGKNGSADLKMAAIVTKSVTPLVESMYDDAARKRIAKSFQLYPEFVTADDIVEGSVDVGGFHALFGTWGFPVLDAAQVGKFKKLEHVFYGAGSIRKFGLPFLEADIAISCAKDANGKIVADFCLGQILLASKRYFQNVAGYHSAENFTTFPDHAQTMLGYRGSKVALIGCGKVSRHLLEHLKVRDFEILVVDPYLSDCESNRLGVAKTSLEDAFKLADVVSNHLPDLSNLRSLIGRSHFESMKEGATFINTGRGAQVCETALADVFERRRDLIALLDVTDPEPPEAGSLLYRLPNILLSSHIAGCVGEEVHLLVDEAIDSAEKWLRGEPLNNIETLDQFDLIA